MYLMSVYLYTHICMYLYVCININTKISKCRQGKTFLLKTMAKNHIKGIKEFENY